MKIQMNQIQQQPKMLQLQAEILAVVLTVVEEEDLEEEEVEITIQITIYTIIKEMKINQHPKLNHQMTNNQAQEVQEEEVCYLF